jgi:hypothetical protein
MTTTGALDVLLGERMDDWPYGWSEGWTDLGDGHLIRALINTKGEPSGWLEFHRNAQGEWCGGGLYRKGHGDGAPEWDVESEDPLTLSPSIQCRDCSNHGYVKQGRWVAV